MSKGEREAIIAERVAHRLMHEDPLFLVGDLVTILNPDQLIIGGGPSLWCGHNHDNHTRGKVIGVMGLSGRTSQKICVRFRSFGFPPTHLHWLWPWELELKKGIEQ